MNRQTPVEKSPAFLIDQPTGAGRAHGCSPFALWRSDYLDGLEVVESVEHRGRYPLHLHEPLEIIWMRSGCGEIVARGQSRSVHAGEACVIRPNEFHGGGTPLNAPIRFCLIHIPPSIIDPVFLRCYFHSRYSSQQLPIKVISRGLADWVLGRLIKGLTRARCAGDQLGAVASALKQLLAADSETCAAIYGINVEHPAIETVMSIICANYSESIHTEDLASSVSLNERYLISLFRQATGVPPHRFQVGIRVDHARRLLPSDTPLSTVAAASGFADQSHLTRHFKRQYGFTPGTFRRLVQPV
ncbi:MAG: helix-turn-helix transcriptional regulator [Gammaproteobacteria bacterium]|nr:helix-turn-helix transcriptional regulator [Gammaproteobacteria bacterium]